MLICEVFPNKIMTFGRNIENKDRQKQLKYMIIIKIMKTITKKSENFSYKLFFFCL